MSSNQPPSITKFGFNPKSKWEEFIQIPDLTLFDIYREPRTETADLSERVQLPLNVLNSEFHCAVCLGYIKNARCVKECLHRFCDECIDRCIRIGKKECPTCRVHIPSKRSVRPDPAFDKLLQSIYGDVEKVEKYEEEETLRLNKEKNMNNFTDQSRKLGIRQQSKQRKKHVNVPSSEIPSLPSSTSRVLGLEESPLIEFVLRRYPQESKVDRLIKEHIRTSREITVEALKIFLAKKLSFSPPSHLQILTVVDENYIVLPDDITLALIRRDICDDPTKEVVLHYRILPLKR
eukprot:CAMPEP_0113372710 /NCGR_PEP_ID=MMETSP0013_2-20120614/679_1 /TAXON_ID=2843 ORGANISM="Skeletonema costatum, Strain 1716" /NCGR_SAMPLE_ID=MMETSP0013_2 /ASSEMBLY_ACC=CAM_ASM_000158 /LENGTH=290 /DNA_ID=CAMNT_0000254619 /DNA_START=39 /DNA_END=911 /DNA_ORIENTATION=- /assembly_acc=CAM_ASM_000158